MIVMIYPDEKSCPLSGTAISGSLGFNNPILKENGR